jgi:cell division septation protein DedD
MKITGRPAQFGRGVISDVADKIIGQFANCVASKLQAEDPPAQESVEETAQVPATVSATAADAASTNGSTASGPALSSTPAGAATAPSPTVTPVKAPSAPMKSEIDAIDLLDTAGAPVLKRLVPVIGGGVLLFLIVFLVRRLRSA